MRSTLVMWGVAVLAAAVLVGVLPSSGLVTRAVAEPAVTDLIENGGFEAAPDTLAPWTVEDQVGGSGSWCPQSGNTAPGVPCGGMGGSGATVQPPPEGSTAAMTDMEGVGSHVLYQCVTLPDEVAAADLSFSLYILNWAAEFSTQPDLDVNNLPNQQFRADVVDAAAMAADPFTVAASDVLLNVYQTEVGDPLESGYSTVSADLSAVAGQEVCVRFAEVDTEIFLNVGVDDVRLEVIEPPEELSPPGELSPVPTVVAPETGAGTSSGGSSPAWLIAALAGAGLAGAAGYTALRMRTRRS